MQKERAPHYLSSTEKDSFKEISNPWSAEGLSLVICYERMDRDLKLISLEKASPGRKLAPDHLPKYTPSIKMIAFLLLIKIFENCNMKTWNKHERSNQTKTEPKNNGKDIFSAIDNMMHL